MTTGPRDDGRGRRRALALASGAIIAAGALGAAFVLGRTSTGEDAGARGADAAPARAVTARLGRVLRPADDPGTGVLVQAEDADAPAPAEPGAPLAEGATLRTDARTLAEVSLTDGSSLVLDHATEVILASAAPLRLRVTRGRLLAEVAPVGDGAPARITTPAGEVDVLGTKLVLTATDRTTSVRVTRGEVRIHGGSRSVTVEAGQEGTLTGDAPPQVAPAVELAAAVNWSELGEDGPDDLPAPGLGELRAHRPGEREERERPLALARHAVTTRISGNVARTEVEETFRNDGDHQLEGVYRFPLPPGARIASLALLVDGKWQEGAFVERDRAKKIWRGVIRNATPEPARKPDEEYIWVPGPWHDPALLEWQRGGRFELRIFPIPARGERQVRLAYTQTLAPHEDGRRYVYPLPRSGDASTRVGRFEVDVRVTGAAHVETPAYALDRSDEGGTTALRYATDDFLAAGDLVIDVAPREPHGELTWWTYRGPATAPPPKHSREVGADVMRAHRALHDDGRGYVAFALRPELPAWTETKRRDYVLVVDSSQSMVGERFERARRLVSTLVDEMDRRDRFVVLACDATCRSLREEMTPPSPGAADQVMQWLAEVQPSGASDLGAALRTAVGVASDARREGERGLRVLYFGDGLASVGHRRASSLAAETEALASRSGATFGTIAIGADADATVLAAVARAGGGHYVRFVPGESTGAAALTVLEATYGVSLEHPVVRLPDGVVDVAPSTLPTIRAGEEIVFVGRLAHDHVQGDVELEGTVGGRPFHNRFPVSIDTSTSKGNAFVPRLWASETIADLDLRGRGEDEARVVALSKAFGVMSRKTSLLVLESPAMFQAFGVDRARPAIQWTGEEDAEAGGSTGTATFRGETLAGGFMGAAGAAAKGAAPPPSMARRARAEAAPRSAGASGTESIEVPFGDRRERPNDSGLVRSPIADPVRRPTQVRMRRVWYRKADVAPASSAPSQAEVVVDEAEAALHEQPLSRDRHRTLVRALSRAGRLDRAAAVAREWLTHDPLDPEALTYLSDAVGRQGRRDEAIRLLSGIVDLAPDDDVLQRRMANAFDRAGMPERACAHRIARAEAALDDADRVAEAVRCERALGHDAGARHLLSMVPDEHRRSRAEKLAEQVPSPHRPRGELMLDAHWQGGDDVDLSLITPQGTRLSWLGGRVVVVGQHGTTAGNERIGLGRVTPGSYLVEVNRTTSGGERPIDGRIDVQALGDESSLPFHLVGNRQVVGRIDVTRHARLEPAPLPAPNPRPRPGLTRGAPAPAR